MSQRMEKSHRVAVISEFWRPESTLPDGPIGDVPDLMSKKSATSTRQSLYLIFTASTEPSYFAGI